MCDTVSPTTNTAYSAILNVNCDAIPASQNLYLWIIALLSLLLFLQRISYRTDSSYSIVRKWLVSDTCGNASEFTQIVNVISSIVLYLSVVLFVMMEKLQQPI
jgi:hypothetical protein